MKFEKNIYFWGIFLAKEVEKAFLLERNLSIKKDCYLCEV